jgi:hypothetical protein
MFPTSIYKTNVRFKAKVLQLPKGYGSFCLSANIEKDIKNLSSIKRQRESTCYAPYLCGASKPNKKQPEKARAWPWLILASLILNTMFRTCAYSSLKILKVCWCLHDVIQLTFFTVLERYRGAWHFFP